MARILAAVLFSRRDVNGAWGEGVHSGKHGAAIFPDTMRRLWRDYKGVKPTAGGGTKQ